MGNPSLGFPRYIKITARSKAKALVRLAVREPCFGLCFEIRLFGDPERGRQSRADQTSDRSKPTVSRVPVASA